MNDHFNISNLTFAVPDLSKPMQAAAPLDKSMLRPVHLAGPRSVILTVTDCPFLTFVTCTIVPNGNVRCAAVSPFGLNLSPFAVRRDRYSPPPYQLAISSD